MSPTEIRQSAGDLLQRDRLMSRLVADRSRVIVVSAPSGFGKSVLLRQWQDQDPRPALRILLGPQHNDPTALVEGLFVRLSELEPLPPDLAEALLAPSPDVEQVLVPRLISALEVREAPFTLVLDEMEQILSPDALNLVSTLCRHLPDHSQLALASRVEIPVGLGRLRASRKLTELGRDEMSMTRKESADLLASLDIALPTGPLDSMVERTEGWPAAIYLVGIALGEASDPEKALAQFTGDDRVVVDYLREEFLQPVSRSDAAFLRRISVLNELSGPLCDFVLKRHDSHRLLKDLHGSNMLLVRLDTSDGEWFRLHPLLREMLESELLRNEPELVPRLHRRASEWWADAGNADQAIHHAIEGRAEELAGELLFAAIPDYSTTGKNATLINWLELLAKRDIANSPGACLTAAWAELTLGNGPKAEQWTDAARRLIGSASPGDIGNHIKVGLALVDATLGRNGIEAMRRTSLEADSMMAEDDRWRALTSLLEGISLHLLGERETARVRLREGVRRGSVGAPNLQVLCLTQLAIIALESGDWYLAESEVSRAREQIDRTGIGQYPMLALAYSTSALVWARRGAVEKASDDLAAAIQLLEILDNFGSWYEVQARIMLARACVRLSRRSEAEQFLFSAEARLIEIPDGDLLHKWLDEARTELGPELTSNGDLTAAELRVLQHLPGHLTFPQIAGELHISPNTAKSHARSIYSKLETTSRREAVARARDLGLLDPSS